MAISLCIKGREEMTEKIIIKPSVQKRFDSFKMCIRDRSLPFRRCAVKMEQD